MTDSFLGTDWFKNFVQFRENPKIFENWKVSSDALFMHILKDLYSDTLSAQYKVNLLLLLQEHSSFLIQDELTLEKVVSSLKDNYLSIKDSTERKLLKSQLLITSTSLLLVWHDQTEVTSKLLVETIMLLLETILSGKKNHIIRTAACRCLEEIERFYPGFLYENLDALFYSYRKLLIPSMQSFAILLSLCLKHNTDILLKIFKPWSIKSGMMIQDEDQETHSFNIGKVHNILDCIIDSVSYMSGTCFYIVFINLIHVIKNNAELLPTVFKTFMPRLIRSSDALHFHLAFVFQKLFGPELLTLVEEKLLVQQLFTSMNHPCLTISHRLLYLDWLENCLLNDNGFIKAIPKSSCHHLLPGPFDGPHTQEKKIRILVRYCQKKSIFDDCIDFLLNCLSGLKRQIMIHSRVKASVAFFRLAFVLYSSTTNPTIQLKIDKFIFDVVTVSPELSSYVLNLLNCMKNSNDNVLNTSLLTMLVEHLINLPPQKFENKLQNYLQILERAAVIAPSICKPEVTLRQLIKLLSMPNSVEVYKWIPGYYILLMCNTFMKLEDIDILYHDLGELLQLLMKNSRDTHIQVQAKQYYAALTSLPKSPRIQALCSNQPSTQHQKPLPHIATRGFRFQSINVMSKLSKPVFELIRLERDPKCCQNPFEQGKIDNVTEFLASYESYIHSENFRPVTVVPFKLRHVSDAAENFSTIYSVVINITPSLPYVKVTDIEVPLLSKDNDIFVNIEFVSLKPYPLSLDLKAKFTSKEGFSFGFSLPSICLELQDLLSIIPMSRISSNSEITCPSFEDLWEFFLAKERCCTTKFHLPSVKSIPDLMEKYWKSFIIELKENNVGMFVAPSSHLLLKIDIVNDAVLVTSLIDDPTLLPYVDIYMKRLKL